MAKAFLETIDKMVRFRKKDLPLLILCFFAGFTLSNWHASAQAYENPFPDSLEYDSIEIDRIFIVGTRKTKDKIVLRELDFGEGDPLSTSNLAARLQRNEEKIFNTSLFLTVKINLIYVSGNKYDVIVRLAERWYFFPIPVFELSDRNFQDWWVNQNHDLSRIEWGLKLYQYNMRGRNETLRLTGQFGYTKEFQLGYSFPSIDRNQRLGMNLYLGYKLNNNTNYKTVDHKHVFLDTDHWLKEIYAGGISTTYRKSFFSFHTLGLNFYYNQVNDTITSLNPGYFGEGEKEQRYFRLSYTYILDNRDIVSYPLKGNYSEFKIQKLGLGVFDDVNLFIASIYHNRFYDLGKNFYLTGGLGGIFSIPVDQPYNMLNAMGIARFTMRGYELYVIEGPQFAQSNWTFRKQLFKTDFNLNDVLPSRKLSGFNVAMYLKTYFDMGYVYGYEGNTLNTRFTNELIYSGGFGIDLVTFYDIVMRFEYSFNKAGESGFVFGVRSGF